MRVDVRSTSTSNARGRSTISFVSGKALRRRRQKLRTSAPRVGEIAPGFVVERVEKTYRGTCRKCSQKKKKKEN